MASKPLIPSADLIHRSLEELCVPDETYHWENPRRFAAYARRLQLVICQLIRSSPEAASSPSVQTALKGIAADLAKIVETVSVYRDKSKIFVLINCRSLSSVLQERTSAIGGWLALLESVLGDSADLRRKVSDLSRDMKRAQFTVTEIEDRVCSTLQREGLGKPTTKVVQSAITMDLARALGVDSRSYAELSEQVNLLKNDLARSDLVSERRIMMSLQRIMDNWSLEPSISGSLEFDNEDESQILPFKNFLCPLTKEVMRDPVVLQSSQTYERSAIDYWFQRCLEDGRDPTCPVTGQVLTSLEQKPNIGLAGAIEEWLNRNIDIQVKLACQHLSENPLLIDCVEKDLDSIYEISEEHPSSRYKIRNAGMILLVINLLKNGTKSVGPQLKCKALMVLLSMAKDEDSKVVMLREGITKLATRSFLGSSDKEKECALKLLLEFSHDEAICVKLASEKGALVLLSSIAGNLENPALSNLAEDVLKRLDVVEDNVLRLAAAGRLEPLINRLCEGSDSVKVKMATLLGQMTLTNNNREQIARQSAKVLVDMLCKPEGRIPSLRVLQSLSTLDDNAAILVDSSILPSLMEILLENQDVHAEEQELSAATIANIVSKPGHWELAVADKKGHRMHSAVIISGVLKLLSHVTASCQVFILQILCGIASSPQASELVASHIKSGDGIKLVFQYLEHSEVEQRTLAYELVRIMSENSSEYLANEIKCVNKLQLFRDKVQDSQATTSERSDAACILANLQLSRDDIQTTLGDEFLRYTITALKEQLNAQSGRRPPRSTTSTMTEGLLGIIVHFANVIEPQALGLIRDCQLMSIFRDKLSSPHSRSKQLAALGLKHLSELRTLISEGESDPQPPQGFCSSMVFMCGKASLQPPTCPIHNTPCEEDSQLCLLTGGCIKPLITLLTDEKTAVQIASVEALSTLVLDTSHSFHRAADELERLGVIDSVISLFIDARPGELQEKTAWMLERLFRSESTSQKYSINQSLVRALVEAMKHGNAQTKRHAQEALTYLQQLSGASGKISCPVRALR
ncbi:hypothetical protein V2J09_006935 [Rumex salicifolius]